MLQPGSPPPPGPPPPLNVAVTDLAIFIVRVQVRAVPAQSPPQLKVEPPVGAAVRVTPAPLVNVAKQTPGQLIPAGLLVTVPVPLPATVTVTEKVPPPAEERLSFATKASPPVPSFTPAAGLVSAFAIGKLSET